MTNKNKLKLEYVAPYLPYGLNFFNNVMVYLGYHGWRIKFGEDSYCWSNNKLITVDVNYKGDLRQIILHEIAHIGTAKYSNQRHTPQFWKHLEFLVKKFINQPLDKYQIEHKKYMSKGIYSLKYKNH